MYAYHWEKRSTDETWSHFFDEIRNMTRIVSKKILAWHGYFHMSIFHSVFCQAKKINYLLFVPHFLQAFVIEAFHVLLQTSYFNNVLVEGNLECICIIFCQHWCLLKWNQIYFCLETVHLMSLPTDVSRNFSS